MKTPTIQRAASGFADLFVARPILGFVVNLLILIAGLAALSSVDVREMPDVDQPVLQSVLHTKGQHLRRSIRKSRKYWRMR